MAKLIPMNATRRAVLVGLAYHWATEQRGATIAEVADAVARHVRRATVSANRCYGILLNLEQTQMATRREKAHGSWKPTRAGMIRAGQYAAEGSVAVRDKVRKAIVEIAALADSEMDVDAQQRQAAASLLPE